MKNFDEIFAEILCESFLNVAKTFTKMKKRAGLIDTTKHLRTRQGMEIYGKFELFRKNFSKSLARACGYIRVLWWRKAKP